jgi:tRNA A-37 threonylcarbamoyl transferase component Bud32
MEALAPDRRLAGRYVLEDRIATGGMATVWRARDEVLARTVAVKCLRDELARDPAFAERFQREAVAAARLTHPNIISVFDTGVDQGASFIVMEYFPGLTLGELMQRDRAMDPRRAIGLILPVLGALGFAHREGLVHRDIKPGNILVSSDARVKVTDFGIAKVVLAEGDLTTTGQVLGTVRYLSPEQVQGSEVDTRADIYSTGLVLYEMVTGRPAFQAENDVATAMMRLTRDPLPPRAIRGGISRGLEVVILRAIARRPEDRFQTAEAMTGALERLASRTEATPPRGIAPLPEPAPTTPASTFRSWMLVPLLVVGIAALAIAGGLALGRLKLGGPLGVRPAPEKSRTPRLQLSSIAIVGGADFDPQGDDRSENPSDVPLAFDGNSGTAWSTEHYHSPEFGNLKDGVGLWVDLGTNARVSRVTITSPTPGWTFELKAGTLPDRLSGPLANSRGATSFRMGTSGTANIELRPVTTRGLLIWITELVPSEGGFAAAVGEVSIRGTPR